MWSSHEVPPAVMYPNTAASQSRRSPDSGPERKRRRKVLSCFDCRRRKLQCDRAMPACSRCTKAGNAANCLYIDEPISDNRINLSKGTIVEARQPSSSRQSMADGAVDSRGAKNDYLNRIECQEQRIKQLEAALTQTAGSRGVFAVNRVPLTPESTFNRSAALPERESMSLRGRSFKTQFAGSTHPGAMITHLSHLNKFTKEAIEQFPALQRMRAEIHALDDRLGLRDTVEFPLRDEDVKNALPPKAEADELVHLYIDTFDPVYHIIHLPTFWKAYDQLWTDLDTSSTHFVAIVLLMMACVSCLTSTQDSWLYRASSSTARERSIRWIISCEDWISRQSQKHVTSADFQIRVLLWLAKQTSARKYKRTWTDAGTLLRFCMSAGLHRNPDLLAKETSQVDRELRRRIWATAVDFELQASFDRGMVSAPWLLQSDTTGPSNVFDEDITSDKPLIGRSPHEFTPSAYLALANESLMLRSTLNAVLNNIQQVLTFDEVKQYTEELESHLRSIPDWSDRRSDIPKALLLLRLRQYLLVLHDRNLRQASTTAEKSFSKFILLETSLQIMETHKSLLAKEKLALEVYCIDFIRVAVSIAHLQSFVHEQADIAFARTFDIMTPQLMDDIVDMARDKVLRFGREAKQLWIVLTCDGIIKTTRHPAQRSIYLQQAVEGVMSPVYKVISSQEISGQTGANGLLNTTHDSAMQAQPLLDPAMLDLDDLAEWTLQDWFTTDDLSNIAPDLTIPSYEIT